MALAVVTSRLTHQVAIVMMVIWALLVKASVSMVTPTRMVRNVSAIAVILEIVVQRPAAAGELALMTPASVNLDGGVSFHLTLQ